MARSKVEYIMLVNELNRLSISQAEMKTLTLPKLMKKFNDAKNNVPTYMGEDNQIELIQLINQSYMAIRQFLLSEQAELKKLEKEKKEKKENKGTVETVEENVEGIDFEGMIPKLIQIPSKPLEIIENNLPVPKDIIHEGLMLDGHVVGMEESQEQFLLPAEKEFGETLVYVDANRVGLLKIKTLNK